MVCELYLIFFFFFVTQSYFTQEGRPWPGGQECPEAQSYKS